MLLYIVFLIFLLLILIYFNISKPLNNPVFISIHPHLLVFTIFYMMFLVIIQFVQNTLILGITYGFISLFFIFILYTLFKILRNIKAVECRELGQNDYKNKLKSFYNEALQIYDGTVMFDEIMEELIKAKNHIHIEFYIFRNHSIAEKIKSVLIQKAKEGIEIRVIYDGLGSLMLKTSYIKDLQSVGVEIKAYDNVFKSIIKGTLNHRNHRKLVIVDGKVGFTGGINIGDEYLGRDESVGNWNDSLVKIKGEAVSSMQKVFLDDWKYVSRQKLSDDKYFPKTEVKNTLPIQIVSSGYNPYGNKINKLYYSIITSAKEELYIITPYLALSNNMMNTLKESSLKGVDIKIILPKKTNHFFASWVNETFFRELLKNNIKIYLHKDGFLHSKIFVADRKVVSIGSANFDSRAQYLDYEVNAVLHDKEQGKQAINQIDKYIATSSIFTLRDYNNRSLIQKFKEKIGILLRPLV